jgi:HAD superfamily hydrolase (TIGR01509 family)
LKKVKEKGIPFAICSNSIKKSVELFLEMAKISGYEFFLSNEDVSNPKPDPQMYIEAMKRMGLKGSEVLIVEDAPKGLISALLSRGRVCQIKDPYDIKRIFDFIEE